VYAFESINRKLLYFYMTDGGKRRRELKEKKK